MKGLFALAALVLGFAALTSWTRNEFVLFMAGIPLLVVALGVVVYAHVVLWAARRLRPARPEAVPSEPGAAPADE